MNAVNLRNVVVAFRSLQKTQKELLYKVWGINPRESELAAIERLIKELSALSPLDSKLPISLLDSCFLGFSIPRISKEFDCLWIGKKTIVNLELKSKSVARDKIEKQLARNRYYLRHLGKTILSFTFDASTGNCYKLDLENNLEEVDIKEIGRTLYDVHKEDLEVDGIDKLFPPEKFLVSPFNSTLEFLDGKYFLTDHQQSIKEKIIQLVEGNNGNFGAITGGPGSGKTLLMYDIARELSKRGKKVVIGHAGVLNKGHHSLNDNGWSIFLTKDLLIYNASTSEFVLGIDADVYFIDEAQRTPHLDWIAKDVVRKDKKCIFSFDTDQVMSDKEQDQGSGNKIKGLAGQNYYALSSNIRTNAAVYEFVNALFDIHHSVNKSVKGHIELTYCQDEAEAGLMLEILKEKGYEVPKFTPLIHSIANYEKWFPNDAMSAHQVIGQEFDDVAGLVSANMKYNENGKLVSKIKYRYREDRMLYQILTRARRRIHLVIVNNPSLLERCLRLVYKNY